MLYTSQPNADAQQTVDAFTAADLDVDVDWIKDGKMKIVAMLQAAFEANAPRLDVLLITGTVTTGGLKTEGRLMPQGRAV